jgi:hypothetical protein
MLEDLKRLDLLRTATKPAPNALLVDSADEPQQQMLHAHLVNLGLRAQFERLPSPRPWTGNPYKMLLPHTIIEKVVAWITAQKQSERK